jgi:hypothetical protein
MQGSGTQQIVIQQPQQAQIIQTSDGQTFIYQPMQLDGAVQQAQPTGISHRLHRWYRWGDWIRMDLREIGWGSVDWIQLAQDRDWWRALVNKVISLRVLAPWS